MREGFGFLHVNFRNIRNIKEIKFKGEKYNLTVFKCDRASPVTAGIHRRLNPGT